MSQSQLDQVCMHCGQPVRGHHLSLHRRVETMSMQDVNGRPAPFSNVISDTILLSCCNLGCWSAEEAAISSSFNLKTTYPTFSWIASCSICNAKINRTTAYVSLALCELEEESQPWLVTATVLDDQEFAVLCHNCDTPGTLEAFIPEEDERTSSTANDMFAPEEI